MGALPQMNLKQPRRARSTSRSCSLLSCFLHGTQVPCSTILVPTTAWAEAMIAHAKMKRKAFLDMMKVGSKGGTGPGWESTWMRMTPERRRAVLDTVRQELAHAVSAYTGNDEMLFSTIWWVEDSCPLS